MEAENVRVVLELDPCVARLLAAAADLKGISVRKYCLSAIDKELARDEADVLEDALAADNQDHEMFAELRREIFKGKPLPGNSVDLLREARETRNAQANSRGIDIQAFERLVKLRQEIFKGKPLPGNSVDLLREAREIRDKQMDEWA